MRETEKELIGRVMRKITGKFSVGDIVALKEDVTFYRLAERTSFIVKRGTRFVVIDRISNTATGKVSYRIYNKRIGECQVREDEIELIKAGVE